MAKKSPDQRRARGRSSNRFPPSLASSPYLSSPVRIRSVRSDRSVGTSRTPKRNKSPYSVKSSPETPLSKSFEERPHSAASTFTAHSHGRSGAFKTILLPCEVDDIVEEFESNDVLMIKSNNEKDDGRVTIHNQGNIQLDDDEDQSTLGSDFAESLDDEGLMQWCQGRKNYSKGDRHTSDRSCIPSFVVDSSKSSQELSHVSPLKLPPVVVKERAIGQVMKNDNSVNKLEEVGNSKASKYSNCKQNRKKPRKNQ